MRPSIQISLITKQRPQSVQFFYCEICRGHSGVEDSALLVWQCVVWWIIADVSEIHPTTIFRNY